MQADTSVGHAAGTLVGIYEFKLQPGLFWQCWSLPACPPISCRALRHPQPQAGAHSCCFKSNPLQPKPVTRGLPWSWASRLSCRKGAPHRPLTSEPMLEPFPHTGNTNRASPSLISPALRVPNPEMGNIHTLHLLRVSLYVTRPAASCIRCKKLFSIQRESKRGRK